MSTYTSQHITSGRSAPSPAGLGDRIVAIRGVVDCAAAPSTTDTMNFFDVPAGFRVVGGYLKSTDMDTNGAPTITLNIGDAGDADRLFAASTVAQAGTVTQTLAATGLDYLYTAKTRITGAANANAATGAAGSVTLVLYGRLEGSAS